MQFKGIGTGIANLILLQMSEREIISPIDPENLRIKIDIHKGRLPVNCNAVLPINDEIYRDEAYQEELEVASLSVCKEHGLRAEILDSAKYIIGNQGCKRRNFLTCQMNCPLIDLCQGLVDYSPFTGRYIVHIDGKRVDTRKRIGQGSLFSWQD